MPRQLPECRREGVARWCATVRRVFAILVLTLAACGSPEAPPPPDDTERCHFNDECGGGVCRDGACQATSSCRERADCAAVPVCAGDRCFCESFRCLPACLTDLECGPGLCEDGVCTRSRLASEPGQPATLGGQGLRAGVARVDLDYPLGVSMAGYGGRRGPDTPYQQGLGGSSGWLDRPDVRALALDDGEEVLILLRLPLGWSTDHLLTATTEKILARTGLNLRDRILSSATHSHAQPARFWRLLPGTGFGAFGYDEFSTEVFDRLTTSFAEAVIAALEARVPARFGHVRIRDFDPEDRISRDRREQNNGLAQLQKDGDLVLARVDDANGQPLAVLVHLGIHGTIFGNRNPLLTGDAGGGIEHELTRAASAKYGRPVLGFFLQGNAGDLSPAGSDRGHDRPERLQLLGRRTWSVVEPRLDQLRTEDASVDVAVTRVALTRETLGYAEGTFHQAGGTCVDAPDIYRYGALKCVETDLGEDQDPSTRYTDGELACLAAVECLTDGRPVPQLMKTTIAAARVGNLAFATSPGEPLSAYGRALSDAVAAAVPTASEAITLGYAMDHHFYLTNEEDWFQGGYEPSMGVWGWRLAPYLAEQTVALARTLDTAPSQRSFGPAPKPTFFADPVEVHPVPTQSEDPAEVLVPPPTSVSRFETVQLRWRGGHPGLDRPVVTLEREVDGRFETVQHPGGLVYDDAGFEIVVTYEGLCDNRACVDHQWQASWQEDDDFALGQYRFRIEGRYRRANGPAPYQLTTAPLTVGAGALVLRTEARGGALVVEAHAPPVPDAVLLRSESTPSQSGAPLRGPLTVTLSLDGTRFDGVTPSSEILSRTRPNGEIRPTTVFTVALPDWDRRPAGAYRLALEVTDAAGNIGAVTATVTKSP